MGSSDTLVLPTFSSKLFRTNLNTAKCYVLYVKPLSATHTNWSNTLEQFVGNLPTNCLSVFDHFVRLTLKGLKSSTFKNECCKLDMVGIVACVTTF